MARLPVSHTLTGKANAAGTAEAVWTLPAHQAWTIRRMAATGDSTDTAAQLRVYRNGVLIDSTGYAVNDVSETAALALLPGDQLAARWAKCSPGAAMALTIDGVTEA